MARALIVGCGCRGSELGRRLLADGWAVRGTTRRRARLAAIDSAGIEAVVADPQHPGTVFELIGDVTVVCWLLGSARGDPDAIGAIHGARLERLVERLVDTPVRGFVYEAAGTVRRDDLDRGARLVEEAGARWRIPYVLLDVDPGEPDRWAGSAHAAVTGLAS